MQYKESRHQVWQTAIKYGKQLSLDSTLIHKWSICSEKPYVHMFGHIFQNMIIYPSNQWISFDMIHWSWKNCRYDYSNLRFNFSSNTYEVAVIRDDMLKGCITGNIISSNMEYNIVKFV